MADSRREHEYDVAIAHACYISGILSGEFNPGQCNPVRNEKTEALQNAFGDPKGKEAFAMLGAGLAMMIQQGA